MNFIWNRVYLILYLFLAWALRKRIAGGKFVKIEDFSYLASIIDNGPDEEDRGEPICGAAIITNQWLVTAGHCVEDLTNSVLKIRTGASKRYNDGELHDIKQIIVHPDFQKHIYTITSDIALIQLEKPMKFSNVQQPIDLAKPTDEPLVGNILTISGFGRETIYADKRTLHLKAAELPIVNLTKCQDDYHLDPVSDKMICAGTSNDSSCRGDSGGPGIMNNRLAAIVSTGFLCDTTNVPAIFTAVYKHLDWIYKYVNIEA